MLYELVLCSKMYPEGRIPECVDVIMPKAGSGRSHKPVAGRVTPVHTRGNNMKSKQLYPSHLG